MRPYELIEHTADAGIRAFGATLSILFANAARGMMDLALDSAAVDETQELDVSISADAPDLLLVEWLNEILFLLDAKRFAPKSFKVLSNDGRNLIAKVRGEPLDPNRHKTRMDIKAVTYHKLEVVKTPAGYMATVIFDV